MKDSHQSLVRRAVRLKGTTSLIRGQSGCSATVSEVVRSLSPEISCRNIQIKRCTRYISYKDVTVTRRGRCTLCMNDEHCRCTLRQIRRKDNNILAAIFAIIRNPVISFSRPSYHSSLFREQRERRKRSFREYYYCELYS